MVCWWYGWLEDVLPARLRDRGEEGEEKVDGREEREEKVGTRGMAQGRVDRGPLSWKNTVLKVAVDLTAWSVWRITMTRALEAAIRFRHPRILLSFVNKVRSE